MNQFTHPEGLSMLEKRRIEAEILKEVLPCISPFTVAFFEAHDGPLSTSASPEIEPSAVMAIEMRPGCGQGGCRTEPVPLVPTTLSHTGRRLPAASSSAPL